MIIIVDSFNEQLLNGAEMVIPYEEYLRMGEGRSYDSEDELEELEDDEDNTQYIPLHVEHQKENKHVYRSVATRRAAILCFKRSMKRKDIAAQFKESGETIRRWKKEWKVQKKIAPGKSTGRPRILWSQSVKWMLDALEKNKSASNL